MEEKNIETGNRPIIKDDEIDLIEVAKTIWAGRKLILKVTAVFFIIGLVIAFGSKVEYEASCTLLPESQEGMKPNLGGGLGSLAGLAGINLDMGSQGVLTPELYPQIAKSTPFLLHVLHKPVFFNKKDTLITSYRYFKEVETPSLLGTIMEYTIGLPFKLKSALSSERQKSIQKVDETSPILHLSKEDDEIINSFAERITVSTDKKSGIITLTTQMPDAVAAADLAQLSINQLTEYITSYQVSKAQENYDFIKARYDEVKEEFENSQIKLAAFTDRNRNFATSLAQAEMQRLQNEYNINFEVFKGLATQLEQAKIKVKEQTPVFTVLEPVKVPVEKSKPKRLITILVSLLSGVIFSIIWILARNVFTNVNFYSFESRSVTS